MNKDEAHAFLCSVSFHFAHYRDNEADQFEYDGGNVLNLVIDGRRLSLVVEHECLRIKDGHEFTGKLLEAVRLESAERCANALYGVIRS